MTINKSELLRDLRALTQAGMKDCKDALEETQWDLQAAVDVVKAKGLSNTSRNAGKVAAEGRLVIAVNENGATMVEVNCQTDFVANAIDFQNFANNVGATFANLDLFTYDGALPSELEAARKEVMAVTKENVVVRRWFRVEASPGGAVVSYLHGNAKLGVLVSFETSNATAPEFIKLADEVAMQIAAMNPVSVSRTEVPQEEVDRQKAIFETQLIELNKPQAAWAKIMDGKFNKWYQDVCLLDQESVIYPKTTVKSQLDTLSKQLGTEVKVLSFVRAAVGDGIEKKTDDLAQAVAEAISASS